jgi:hypothetical protein
MTFLAMLLTFINHARDEFKNEKSRERLPRLFPHLVGGLF